MEKTCGNCGNCRSIGNCHGVCLEGYSGPLSNEVPVVPLSGSCMMVPDSWRSENEPTIEQSYQQLTEVARGMLEEIKTMAGSYGYTADLDHEHKYEWIEDCVRPWREKLEELGVEL